MQAEEGREADDRGGSEDEEGRESAASEGVGSTVAVAEVAGDDVQGPDDGEDEGKRGAHPSEPAASPAPSDAGGEAAPGSPESRERGDSELETGSQRKWTPSSAASEQEANGFAAAFAQGMEQFMRLAEVNGQPVDAEAHEVRNPA